MNTRQTKDSTAAGYGRVLRTVAVILALMTQAIVSADESADVLQQLLTQLDAPDFQARLKAERKLEDLQPAQIRRLVELAPKVESAEAAVRILHGLDRHYASDNEEAAAAASDVLESLIYSDRAVIAEEATWMLMHRWRRRQQFAVAKLSAHGAQVVLPEVIAKAQKQNIPLAFADLDRPRIQVVIGSEWDGTAEARRALEQLPGLAQQMMPGQGAGQRRRRGLAIRAGQTPPEVTIFLVAGHPLNEEQAAQLKGAFGETVQDRGETMLGIMAQPGVAGTGCLVRKVVDYGSAATAGLRSGDLITHVQNEKIGSFDDLVEELRKFSTGDVVTLQCIRDNRRQPDRESVETLQVTLRSWSDYARAINAAVAAPADTKPANE